MNINYDGKRFRSTAGDPHADTTVAIYRQEGDLLWGDFAGGEVRRGSLTGISNDSGVLNFAYTMVLLDGEVVAGRCHSEPEILPDGRIRLAETWQRYDANGGSQGVSELEEIG